MWWLFSGLTIRCVQKFQQKEHQIYSLSDQLGIISVQREFWSGSENSLSFLRFCTHQNIILSLLCISEWKEKKKKHSFRIYHINCKLYICIIFIIIFLYIIYILRAIGFFKMVYTHKFNLRNTYLICFA